MLASIATAKTTHGDGSGTSTGGGFGGGHSGSFVGSHRGGVVVEVGTGGGTTIPGTTNGGM